MWAMSLAVAVAGVDRGRRGLGCYRWYCDDEENPPPLCWFGLE